ncbi:MAG TPA: hypothetical protein ENK57_24440 [Polyangiaceae bacterium]|nr:hypothetical protein [Polyangiaceae bacterium]
MRRPLYAIASLCLLAACGPPRVASQTYALSLANDPDATLPAAWAHFMPGERVVLAPSEGCPVEIADDVDALEDQPGELKKAPWLEKASAWQIDDSMVRVADDTGGGYLALAISQGTQHHWLRLDAGETLSCVQPVTPAIIAALKLRGTTQVFTPWKPGCREIQAAGHAPRSALLESEPGTTLQVDDVVFAPKLATDSGPGGEPWVEMNNRTLRVRADVIASCFTDGAGGAIEPPDDASAMLHMPAERCTEDEHDGKRHMKCTTTVGVWEGVTQDRAVALQLVHRTLGPVHFLDGRPVSGGRWADAVVAVTMGERSDSRVAALYDVMERTIAETVAAEDGAVRIATVDDPAVTYRVDVEVSKVSIGELETRTSIETSEYQDGTRTEPNPKKAEARDRVANAEAAMAEAEADYQSDLAQGEALREGCISACNEAKNQLARDLCKAGCKIPQVSQSGVNNARSELAQARAQLENTPDTIEIPIMKTWSYDKKHFARSTDATLSIVMQPTGGEARRFTIPLSMRWTDYEVEADPEHNVKGHRPDRGPIDNANALVPFIAKQANARLSEKLRAAISQATIREALAALAAEGTQAKAGYEDVDAMAYALAGRRLRTPVQRGRGAVPASDRPYPLPAKAAPLTGDECLVAVAVVADGGATITIRGNDGRHGDLRDKSYAAVEICGSELPGDTRVVDDLAIFSRSGSNVRWGLYRAAASGALGETDGATRGAVTAKEEQ